MAIVSGGTAVSYNPDANYNGPDTFTYTVSDGNGGTATATVTVNVAVRQRPADGRERHGHGRSRTAGPTTIDVLANDTVTRTSGRR